MSWSREAAAAACRHRHRPSVAAGAAAVTARHAGCAARGRRGLWGQRAALRTPGTPETPGTPPQQRIPSRMALGAAVTGAGGHRHRVTPEPGDTGARGHWHWGSLESGDIGTMGTLVRQGDTSDRGHWHGGRDTETRTLALEHTGTRRGGHRHQGTLALPLRFVLWLVRTAGSHCGTAAAAAPDSPTGTPPGTPPGASACPRCLCPPHAGPAWRRERQGCRGRDPGVCPLEAALREVAGGQRGAGAAPAAGLRRRAGSEGTAGPPSNAPDPTHPSACCRAGP